MFFSVVSLPFVVQKSADFVFKLLPVREIELIPADEKLIGNILCCVFDHEFVLVCAKHNADLQTSAVSRNFVGDFITT